MRSYAKMGWFVLFAAIVLTMSVAISSVTSKPQAVKASILKPLTAESTVDEVLDFAQASKTKWKRIYVEGHVNSGNSSDTFKTWVVKPDKYRSEEGPSILIKNGNKQIIVQTSLKKVREYNVPASTISAQDKAALDERMAVERAKDPTLAEDGELLVNTPINDYINPSYFVRRELKHYAKSIERVGLTTVSGRNAVQLKVVFPKELAKEDHWDVYIDCETGIMLGLVIHPLPGNEKFEQFIDKVEINPSISEDKFTFTAPADYTVEKGGIR
ncbi:MAG: DUF2092 domain-containing protein [Firmicutes bacterium]|nr:DUF2092 domain-containing protein [Bacillota bacterium]